MGFADNIENTSDVVVTVAGAEAQVYSNFTQSWWLRY
jgi:hypothetical protein